MPEPSPARKPWWRRWFGSRSERAAARFLKRLGYRIVARNYSCPLGELDLIALDNGCIVFVEVRSTGGGDSLRAAASVDDKKQKRLTNLAVHYLQARKLLDHAALLQHDDLVRPMHGRESLRDHKRSAPDRQLAHRFLNQPFRAGVHARSGVVE